MRGGMLYMCGTCNVVWCETVLCFLDRCFKNMSIPVAKPVAPSMEEAAAISLSAAPQQLSAEEDNAFRRNMKPGDFLDVFDSEHKWTFAEIIAARNNHHRNGEPEVQVTYVGWPPKWNEWIARTNIRLQPYVILLYRSSHACCHVSCWSLRPVPSCPVM